MNLTHADAYPRRLLFLTKLILPYGTIDLATNIPDQDVTMIGTKAMLVARDDLHPALIMQELDRIERAVEQIHTPASFASEAYTLREHIGLVRRAIVAKAGASARAGS